MVADYTGARVWCEKCGAPLMQTSNGPCCSNVRCETNDVDWSKGITEPGAIKTQSYAEIMADARRLLWRPIETMPTDRSIIVGVAPPSAPDMWYMKRMPLGTNHIIWCAHTGLAATHWAEDILGTP